MYIQTLEPMVPVLMFDAVTDLGDVKSAVYAIPPYIIRNTPLIWQAIPSGGTPSGSIALEQAIDNIDAEFVSISTLTLGAAPVITQGLLSGRFVRIHQSTRGGTGAVTIKLMITS